MPPPRPSRRPLRQSWRQPFQWLLRRPLRSLRDGRRKQSSRRPSRYGRSDVDDFAAAISTAVVNSHLDGRREQPLRRPWRRPSRWLWQWLSHAAISLTVKSRWLYRRVLATAILMAVLMAVLTAFAKAVVTALRLSCRQPFQRPLRQRLRRLQDGRRKHASVSSHVDGRRDRPSRQPWRRPSRWL